MQWIKTVFLLLLSAQFAWAVPKEVRLSLLNTSFGYSDETRILLNQGTTPAFVTGEDFQKVLNQSPIIPQIYSFTTDAVPCSSNSYGVFSAGLIIPLGIKIDTTGTFQLSASLLNNIDTTTLIILEDRTLGTFKNLRTGAYTFQLSRAVQDNQRFFLHINYPPQLSISDASCINNDGAITVSQDSSINWSTCSLFTSGNTLVATYSNVSGTFSFTHLAEDNYPLLFTYSDYSAAKIVHVHGTAITAKINSAPQIYTTVGQPVQLYSVANNTTNYEWDFGDGTIITGIANPQMIYYDTGVFTVVLTCTNRDGCVVHDTITITVSQATGINETAENRFNVFSEGKNIFIVRHAADETEFEYQVLNVSGQAIASGNFTSGTLQLSLAEQANGIYIVRLYNKNTSYSKRIFAAD